MSAVFFWVSAEIGGCVEQHSGRTGCSLSPVSIERDKAYLSYTRDTKRQIGTRCRVGYSYTAECMYKTPGCSLHAHLIRLHV